MSNIFIKETKSFYNYINTTHCKDFKDDFIKFSDIHNNNSSTYCFFSKKKKIQSVYNLFSSVRNDEFIKIKNYIFKEYSEENEFEEWVKLLKNFADFVFNFSDPLFISPDEGGIIVKKNDKECKLTITSNELFEFSILFEKSKIKKSNTSLFDSITGLDKENNLSFITIEIINTISKSKYVYKYMDDSVLNSENPISEDICDLQLEYVKSKLNTYMYNYIGIVFDTIVNNDLKLNYYDFRLFNSLYIRNNYKDLEKEWLMKNITTE